MNMRRFVFFIFSILKTDIHTKNIKQIGRKIEFKKMLFISSCDFIVTYQSLGLEIVPECS